jgi:RNA polymerase sigma factor (sigma-70 family)
LPNSIENIIEGCKQLNVISQKELYYLCYDQMNKVCRRFCDDPATRANLYNDAMYKVFKNIGSYNEEGNIYSWVKRIVVNTCIDLVRKKIKIKPISIAEINEVDTTIEESILLKFTAESIRNLIAKLTPSQSTVFNLYVYEDYSHKEIAALLNIPEGTSKYYLSEARKKLKELVKSHLN